MRGAVVICLGFCSRRAPLDALVGHPNATQSPGDLGAREWSMYTPTLLDALHEGRPTLR